MTPEQREAARIIVFWRHSSPILHRIRGVQQDHTFGHENLSMVIRSLRAVGAIPLYVVRGVEVRRSFIARNIRAWKDERTGQWRPLGSNATCIVVLKHGLTDEERAVLRRASGGITPSGEPPTSF